MGVKKHLQKLFCGCAGRKKNTAKDDGSFERYEPFIKQEYKEPKIYDLDDFEEEIVTRGVRECGEGRIISKKIKRVKLTVMEELQLLLLKEENDLLQKMRDQKAESSMAVSVISPKIGNKQTPLTFEMPKLTFEMPKLSDAFKFVPEMVPPIFSGHLFQNKLINFDCINLASQSMAHLALLPCPPTPPVSAIELKSIVQDIGCVLQPQPLLALPCSPPTLAIKRLPSLPFPPVNVGKAHQMLALRALPSLTMESFVPFAVQAPQMVAKFKPPATTLSIVELSSVVAPDSGQASKLLAPVVQPCHLVAPQPRPPPLPTMLDIELPFIIGKGKELFAEQTDVGFFELDITSPLSRHWLKLPQDAASAVELLNKILEDEGFEDSKIFKDDAIVNLK